MKCYRACVLFFTGISILLLLFWFLSSENAAGKPSTHEVRSGEGEMRNILKMLQSVDFEVFGRVQGVFFRKFTREKGKELGLKGWCMNSSQGTVVGTIQGKEEKIEEMKDWLRHTGSPMSKIEKCVFTNERHISKEEFTDFFIKH
ncbi:acylphosphatase-2-like isoform X2 [Stegodyphus dumicola]|uniref:acylphosphatase-2-like isoform X2 n=1 Tax=Stegodyphus dumicola TaxID=202533 RepID=UPI0015AB0520|nr:acylphosphatase-2-like isoform X2 [Stegodyphus dumicola]